MLEQVLLHGLTSFQKLILGAGLNPNGSISQAPVAKARTTANVTVSPEPLKDEELPSLQNNAETTDIFVRN